MFTRQKVQLTAFLCFLGCGILGGLLNSLGVRIYYPLAELGIGLSGLCYSLAVFISFIQFKGRSTEQTVTSKGQFFAVVMMLIGLAACYGASNQLFGPFG